MANPKSAADMFRKGVLLPRRRRRALRPLAHRRRIMRNLNAKKTGISTIEPDIPTRRTFTLTVNGWVMTRAATMRTTISIIPGSMAALPAGSAVATCGAWEAGAAIVSGSADLPSAWLLTISHLWTVGYGIPTKS